ncbi:unnamed protein product, partial [Urochloa humidicola]
ALPDGRDQEAALLATRGRQPTSSTPQCKGCGRREAASYARVDQIAHGKRGSRCDSVIMRPDLLVLIDAAAYARQKVEFFAASLRT